MNFAKIITSSENTLVFWSSSTIDIRTVRTLRPDTYKNIVLNISMLYDFLFWSYSKKFSNKLSIRKRTLLQFKTAPPKGSLYRNAKHSGIRIMSEALFSLQNYTLHCCFRHVPRYLNLKFITESFTCRVPNTHKYNTRLHLMSLLEIGKPSGNISIIFT